MSKKPASLTSDLLARKGEAEPSTIDPTARMTLSAGPGYSDYGGGDKGEGTAEDQAQAPIHSEEPRPVPPEPEIIYTAEETSRGGGSSRLIIIAVLGVIIVGGIFLAMSGTQTNSVAPVAENIVPRTEEPSAPVQMTEATDSASGQSEVTAKDASAGDTSTVDGVPEESKALQPATPDDVADAVVAETPAAPLPIEETKPVAEAKSPVEAPAPVAKAEPVAAAKPLTGGAYVVQLLALRDEASARAAWNKVYSKNAQILGAHTLDIEEADLGTKGTWFRVRAAGFETKSSANAVCAKLKANGQDCMVRRR
tara:strand:- start:212227 stop:213156 length:930 start_codon:yes stop_codon:yes gene_type:complete